MTGLSDAEVKKRIETGQAEGKTESVTKSIPEIIRENTLTLFNLLNFVIACLLFYAGAYSNMFFIVIIIMNIAIGIYQQIKAKRLVDELSVLHRCKVRVIRNDQEIMIEREEIVKDDVLVLESGMQVSNDAEVLEGCLEMNESLLTGESDAITKNINDRIYSGSFVSAGKAYAKVIHVGDENYASHLVNEVRNTKLVNSEFLRSMRKVTRFTTLLIVPLGILLMIEALYFQNTSFSQAIVNTAAALLGMLPKGLVLLMSVSLANGVISLSKKEILIQNAYALESMAHIDTLCLDKTGTITTGALKVKECISLHTFERSKVLPLMQSYMYACEDNNATFCALKEYFQAHLYYPSISRIPFSSERKWSAIAFQNQGTIFIGAPDQLMHHIPACMQNRLKEGYRMIAAAYSPSIWTDKNKLPEDLTYLYGIALEDQIRDHAFDTIRYLQSEGIECRLISGDHIQTVCCAAQKAGFRHLDAIDLSKIQGKIDYEMLVKQYSIFARVSPKQKQKIVKALKKQGHQTAMCGDGVNDLLAMKEADCAIAINEGSEAGKQLAEIVLLDSDFTHLPDVIKEGRKAVNNVTRSAGVFFIKTIYSMFISILCVLLNIPFPFIPLQITLIDAFIEAYPSFITIVESDTSKVRGNFLKLSLQRAFPFALVITILIVCMHLTHPFNMEQEQTMMYLALIFVSLSAVVKSCIPFDRFRAFVCLTMSAGIFGVLLFMPDLFHVVPVTVSMVIYLALMIVCISVLVYAFLKFFRLSTRKPHRREVHSWQA